MLWGDGPADIMDDALEGIERQFVRAFGRKPTMHELAAGFRIALSVHIEMRKERE